MNATQTASSRTENLTALQNYSEHRPALTLPETTSSQLGRSVRQYTVGNLKSPKHVAVLLIATLVAVALGYGGYRWWEYDRIWAKTDNAYVAAHIHTISARVPGTVKEVLVEENQAVAAGALVARLDDSDLAVARQQAAAQLAAARAQSHQAQAKITEAKAQIAREQAHATKAQQDWVRAQSLYQDRAGAISKQEFDQARMEFQGAEAALEAAQAVVASAEAAAVAVQAQEQLAQANLQQANLQLSYTEIRAPTGGRIGRKNIETGNRVQTGQALLALVETEVWVAANFKETQLTGMKAGQTVRVTVDAVPGRTFTGTIESLAPASGAQFALLPPENATGNFTKIVQRISVRVLLDGNSLGGFAERLVPGMSAVVKVNVGRG